MDYCKKMCRCALMRTIASNSAHFVLVCTTSTMTVPCHVCNSSCGCSFWLCFSTAFPHASAPRLSYQSNIIRSRSHWRNICNMLLALESEFTPCLSDTLNFFCTLGFKWLNPTIVFKESVISCQRRLFALI